MEIERKFLLRAVPGGKILSVSEQQQGYFSLDPEVRFRTKQPVEIFTLAPNGDPTFFATIKSAASTIRDEVEGQISEDFFNHMKEKINKPFISKLQYKILHHGHVVEVSIVDKGEPTSFIYAEVEFESEAEMNKYIWPWPNILIKEVSNDPAYYMQSYWKRTRGE